MLSFVLRVPILFSNSCSAGVSFNPLPSSSLSSLCVTGSYERAWRLGHAVLEAKREKRDPVEAMAGVEEVGKILVRGKVRALRLSRERIYI